MAIHDTTPKTSCGCRQAQSSNSAPAARLGFASTAPVSAAIPWWLIAALAGAALLIYAALRSRPEATAKRAARSRYRKNLKRIEARFA